MRNPCACAYLTTYLKLVLLARVVRKVDNTIHQINHFPVDRLVCFVTLIHWIEIYPVDSVIQPLNNWGLVVNSFNI